MDKYKPTTVYLALHSIWLLFLLCHLEIGFSVTPFACMLSSTNCTASTWFSVTPFACMFSLKFLIAVKDVIVLVPLSYCSFFLCRKMFKWTISSTELAGHCFVVIPSHFMHVYYKRCELSLAYLYLLGVSISLYF